MAVFANTPARFAGIAKAQGFEVRELPRTFSNKVIARMQSNVLKRYDEEGYERLQDDPDKLFPVQVWMSRTALLERYGT